MKHSKLDLLVWLCIISLSASLLGMSHSLLKL